MPQLREGEAKEVKQEQAQCTACFTSAPEFRWGYAISMAFEKLCSVGETLVSTFSLPPSTEYHSTR